LQRGGARRVAGAEHGERPAAKQFGFGLERRANDDEGSRETAAFQFGHQLNNRLGTGAIFADDEVELRSVRVELGRFRHSIANFGRKTFVLQQRGQSGTGRPRIAYQKNHEILSHSVRPEAIRF